MGGHPKLQISLNAVLQDVCISFSFFMRLILENNLKLLQVIKPMTVLHVKSNIKNSVK